MGRMVRAAAVGWAMWRVLRGSNNAVGEWWWTMERALTSAKSRERGPRHLQDEDQRASGGREGRWGGNDGAAPIGMFLPQYYARHLQDEGNGLTGRGRRGNARGPVAGPFLRSSLTRRGVTVEGKRKGGKRTVVPGEMRGGEGSAGGKRAGGDEVYRVGNRELTGLLL
ncbi:hypothetical protein BDQ17DRAFT_1336275 [Cyathus striatus]|nr:hypothetical protein BDQ17DRAFT_1336275 [Cyathus striatus]